MSTENDSQKEIEVTVEVPAPETPEPEAPAAPVVVVTDAAPAPAATDAVLAALMDLTERQTRMEAALMEAQNTAWAADSKASTALEADAEILEVVEGAAAAAAEASEEAQAPADDDVEPVKAHWLHR